MHIPERKLEHTLKTLSILFASAVMNMKHLLTTYFTVYLYKRKNVPTEQNTRKLIVGF